MKNENKYELSIEEIKKDAESTLNKFKLDVDNRIAKIAHFTYNNLNELLTMIFNDCKDLTELEEYTEILKNRIRNNLELKEKLLYQRTLTKKDIINENLIEMYLLYNAILVSVWLTSSDMLVFIKNFLILSGIGVSSFGINLKYFTSEYRKKQIASTITNLDREVELSKYNIEIFNKFHEIYIKELTFEIIKLCEINKNRHNGYERIEKFLNDMQIEFLLKDNTIKRKIRKK